MIAKRASQAEEPDPWSEVTVASPATRTEPPSTVVIHHPEESDPWSLVAHPAHPVVPAPTQSEADALIDAIFAGSRTLVTPVQPIDRRQAQYAHRLIERVTKPSTWWPPSMLRWVAPALVAFVIGVLFTVFELRMVQPRPTTLSTERGATNPIATLPLPSRPLAPTPLASTLPRPGVIGSRVAELRAGTRPVAPPVATPAPSVANRTAAPSVPSQPRPVIPGAPLSPSAPIAPSAPVPGVPIANAPLSSAAVAPAPTPVPALPARAPAPTAATETAAAVPTRPGVAPVPSVPEDEAVRRALGQYIAAFDGLDVTATAQIWPSVDRRALTRAFASIKSQDIAFESCDVKAAGSNATARCRGTLQYVRRVGSPGPHTEPEQWLFKMQKYGTDWKIDQVTASQQSSSHAASSSR